MSLLLPLLAQAFQFGDEIALCVGLYLTVLFIEFSPAAMEWLGLKRARAIVVKLTLLLTIFGVVLSTLHQSSLGALFLIAQSKLHPLWYSSYLLVYFFVTAYRDFRDNYGVELFAELGYGAEPTIFTRTEVPVAFGVMAILLVVVSVRERAGERLLPWTSGSVQATGMHAVELGVVLLKLHGGSPFVSDARTDGEPYPP